MTPEEQAAGLLAALVMAGHVSGAAPGPTIDAIASAIRSAVLEERKRLRGWITDFDFSPGMMREDGISGWYCPTCGVRREGSEIRSTNRGEGHKEDCPRAAAIRQGPAGGERDGGHEPPCFGDTGHDEKVKCPACKSQTVRFPKLQRYTGPTHEQMHQTIYADPPIVRPAPLGETCEKCGGTGKRGDSSNQKGGANGL